MLFRIRPLVRLTGVAAALLVLPSCADQVVQPVIPGRSAARSADAVAGPSGLSLAFDAATSSAATEAGHPITTDVTDLRLEAWVKWTGGGGSIQTIVYNGHTGTSGWGIILSDGLVSFLAGGIAIHQSFRLPVNEWHRVAAERQANGNGAIYLDDNVNTFHDAVGTIDAATARTMVGATVNGADAPKESFNGDIDDVRISHLDGTVIEEWDFEGSDGRTAVGQNGGVLALRDVNLLGGSLAIAIDPRHEHRQVEPERGGRIAVAVLASAGFNPASIDPGSVRFGRNHAAPIRANRGDVDHDRRRDRVYHFDLAATGLTCLDTVAVLTATIDGVPVSGAGHIRTLAAAAPAHSFVARCANPRIVGTELAPNDPNFTAMGLNDRGQVTAFTFDDDGTPIALRWDDGVLTAAPAVAGQGLSNILPMNAKGVMGIEMADVEGTSAWTWDRGLPRRIDVRASIQSFDAINDQGDAVGHTLGGTGLWRVNNGKTDSIVVPLHTILQQIALTNNAVLGFTERTSTSSRVGVWSGKKLTYYSGVADSAIGLRMNERGQIAGYAPAGASVWSADGARSFGAGQAVWINDPGDVAVARDGDLFLWHNGRATQMPGERVADGFRGMNDKGEMIVTVNEQFPLFYQPDGSSTSLIGGQILGLTGLGMAVNDRSQVLGTIQKNGAPIYVLWTVSR